MRSARLFLFILALLFVTVLPLMAEESTTPPLQLAPGSGVQSGQNVPPAMMGMQEEPLRDIHGPVPLPEKQDYTVLIIGALLFCLLLAGVIWWFWFRRKKVLLPAADEVALAALMRARSLITAEQPLQYATELSLILRRYIEARFRIQSTRQTTKEFFTALTEEPQQEALFAEDHSERLQECLEECDMAKFARYTPDRNSMEKMESAVQYFVESTTTTRGEEK